MSQHILAIRTDHKGALPAMYTYHIGCYPWPIAVEEATKQASDVHVSLLTRTKGYEGVVDYSGLSYFVWQKCSGCGKAILPYRHTVTYRLAGNTQQVGIDDVVKHYHYYWNMAGHATLEMLTIDYQTGTVEVRFWTYESCASVLVHRTAINGVLPTIETERADNAIETKSE